MGRDTVRRLLNLLTEAMLEARVDAPFKLFVSEFIRAAREVLEHDN